MYILKKWVRGVLVKSFATAQWGQQVVIKPTLHIPLSVQHTASKFGFVMDLKEICQLIIKLFGQERYRRKHFTEEEIVSNCFGKLLGSVWGGGGRKKLFMVMI